MTCVQIGQILVISGLRMYEPVTCNFISEERIQIADAGNQIAWIAHSRNPLDPQCQMSYSMRYALCSMPRLRATRDP